MPAVSQPLSGLVSVEQIDDEITVTLSGIIKVHFELTADQALQLSRALLWPGRTR